MRMMKVVGCIAMLAACDGGGGGAPIDTTLRFSERTPTEISRLLNAAGGTDMFSAMSRIDSFAPSFDDPLPVCPNVTVAGSVVTLTGGCITEDQVELRGVASVTNPQQWDDQVEYDFGTPTVYELDQFELVQSGFVQAYDGEVTVTDFVRWDADLTAKVSDGLGGIIEVRSVLRYTCAQASQTCSLSRSGVELVGVGGASAAGTVMVTGTGMAEYTLRGADTLTATVTQGCVRYRIDGGPETLAGNCPQI